ncbi:MAG: Cell division protein FtsQ [Chlamydiae bacterium]|nr:Cell division protein FtsQ [Chlamydiota bacterium]
MSLSKKVKPLYAFLSIFASILVFSGLPLLFINLRNEKKSLYKIQKRYQIKEIIQKGPVKEALKTVYLSEILDLSIDHPQNLFAFDTKRAEQLLLSTGVISSARVTKIKPNTIEVDYEVREPIAYLGDYTNTVMDSEGVIFPLTPYYTPKVLITIYLGIKIDPFTYGKIEHEKMELALKIYQLIARLNLHKGVFIDQIDLSKLSSESLGKQEIVLTLYETLGGESYIRYIRLSKNNYEEELMNFLDLKAMNLPKNLVVDLRMLPNAYLTPLELQ